ncbi:MAG: hypothetical protein P4L56_12035 [Candidatus Sulfopaludibacter sp.]|nr:hypothetical protein [Candidatus Sulfopaludibacter sp.]
MFQTIGALLTKRVSDRVVSLGTTSIVISLDGLTTEVFDAIRRRASQEKIIANIENINRAKRRLKVNQPTPGIEFVAMRRNIHELWDIVRLAAELVAAHVQVAELTEYNTTGGESLIDDPQMAYRAEQAE